MAAECGFSDQSHLTRAFRTDGRRKSGRVASGSQAVESEQALMAPAHQPASPKSTFCSPNL
ncbi:hypothetical protein [Bradyrhizobium sp. AZCC 2230]|uniref:hypothetical protein n=1 Tax=Bradyrhizobium sp. AZCC 2230 TaxID=3117021 RepID=UPI002FF171D1